MNAVKVLEHRLLSVLGQTLVVELPHDWKRLCPEEGQEYETAAILLRLAEAADRDGMIKEVVRIAAATAPRRRVKNKETDPLWQQLEAALEGLGQGAQGPAATLFQLRLWQDVANFPLRDICKPFQAVVPRAVPVSESFLTRVARRLLRTVARRWIGKAELAKQHDRQEAAR